MSENLKKNVTELKKKQEEKLVLKVVLTILKELKTSRKFAGKELENLVEQKIVEYIEESGMEDVNVLRITNRVLNKLSAKMSKAETEEDMEFKNIEMSEADKKLVDEVFVKYYEHSQSEGFRDNTPQTAFFDLIEIFKQKVRESGISMTPEKAILILTVVWMQWVKTNSNVYMDPRYQIENKGLYSGRLATIDDIKEQTKTILETLSKQPEKKGGLIGVTAQWAKSIFGDVNIINIDTSELSKQFLNFLKEVLFKYLS